MATIPVSAEVVAERINAMRITAEQSVARVRSVLTSNPQPLARVVVAYRAIVAETGARLIRAQAQVIRALAAKPGDPALTALLRRTVVLLTAWSAHAQGYTQYERPANEAEKGSALQVGAAPAVIIAVAAAGAVIAVSLTGIAWAVVHYKEAQNLADEVALLEKDPSVADALAKLNQTAPRSDPPSPPGAPEGGGRGWFLAALGVAGAAVFFVPKLGKG